MNNTVDLTHFTETYFDSINFSEINDRWIDEVIDNEFTDVEENEITSNILFTNDATESLLNIIRVCEAWCSRSSINKSMDPDEESEFEEEVLWTYLNEIDINVKQILGLVYLLCSKAIKTSSSPKDKELGLASAKLYFSCLKVPGSAAYSVFHPNLFRLCVDCLQMPSHVSEAHKTSFPWKEFEQNLTIFISALETLIPLLSNFHLGDDVTTVDHTIQKLAELIACDVSNSNLNFDLDLLNMNEKERRRRYSSTYIVSLLACKGLLTFILCDLNGEIENNCALILASLSHHITCVKVKKATTIPKSFIVIKNNAVSLVRYILNCNKDTFSKPTQISLKRLCLSVCDKSEFRTAVANSVFLIMFDLKQGDLIDFLKWLLLLVDSSEANNRTFALELLGLLLNDNVPEINKTDLAESDVAYTTFVPVIFAILTRCDDVSPSVRSKALTVLSQYMKNLLNTLMEMMKDVATAPREEFEDEYEINVNGDHRSFWYNLKSYRNILDEIAAILHRRAEDSNIAARKAALQALENLMIFDLAYLSEENLKLFVLGSKDMNVTTRKQVMHSLTTVLDAYPYNSQAQDCWLKSILPLVHDPDTNVHEKALGIIEDRFLHHVYSDNHRDAAFNLVGKLSCGEYLSHQRYLKKAFGHWKSENHLRPQNVYHLQNCFGGGNDSCIWFYLSIFSGFCHLPEELSKLTVLEFEKCRDWENNANMEYILKIIAHTFKKISHDKLKSIIGILMEKLLEFAASLELIPIMIEILCNIQKHLSNNEDFSRFADKMMQVSENHLSAVVLDTKNTNIPSDELIAKCLTIVKEFCHFSPRFIKPNLTNLLKVYVCSYHTSSLTSGGPASKISPILRAHAFASIGKIALQDNVLAKELIPILAKELISSQEDAIRNNVVIILIEMCKRYTGDAGQYVPLISLCFKDRVYIIRYQAITLLVALLQEGFIKWKGALFFCLLSTIIDKKETIQELGKYCLCELLLEKKKSIFADHFVDSIFVFNHYSPPDNEQLSRCVKDLERFALLGPERQEERMHLYKFMLTYMDVNSRTYLIPELVRNILSSVAENVFPLNSITMSMVRDCFAIICCKEIRAVDIEQVDIEEETDKEMLTLAEKEARKFVMIQPVIPVIISLTNCAAGERSELLSDIIQFLKEILQDYKDEIPDLLAGDKNLIQQVQFEFNQEKKQQELEAKEKNKKDKKLPLQNDQPNVTKSAVEIAKERTELILQQEMENLRRESGMHGENLNNSSLRLISKTPRSKSMLRRSTIQTQDMEVDSLPGPSSAGSSIALPEGVNFSSTPRVVLNRVKLPDHPNISSIVLPEDSDSD